MKRKLLIIAVLAAAGATVALYFPLDFLRPSVERAFQRGLGRKVDVGHVYLNLFGVPGFTFEDVTIHEDPRAGIEPFAYVPSLNAGVRVLSLFRHRLVFSSLNLGDASLNLVKTPAGAWNFQYLLENAAARDQAPPSVKIRGGRVNFKFGDTKSVFYFNDADLDVSPYGNGSVELRFGGAPSRTDRSAQDFGLFFVRANWTVSGQPRLDAQVELERSSLDEISRLMDPRGFGLHGIVALRAQLSGPPSALKVTGRLQADDVHRWDLLPQHGGWSLPLEGTLDLSAQRLELASAVETPAPPLALQLRIQDFLSKPRWQAGARLNQVPLAALVEVARHMGAAVPEKLMAEGGVSGDLNYTEDIGLTGAVELRDAVLSLPDAAPLRASSATVSIGEGSMHVESSVGIGEKESAEVVGDYTLEAPRALDLRIETRGMNVADMRSFGLAAIPLLDRTPQGSWRGWARYHSGEWSGEYELQNARIAVEGMADPLRIQSASVKLSGKRVAVSRLRARAGEIAFTGEYRWDPEAVRPHQFHLEVPRADAAELARLFAPTLGRERGFLARTLRLGSAPAPGWLKSRRADGTVSIGALSFGDVAARLGRARLLWDAGLVRLAGVEARVMDTDTDQAGIEGDLEIGLEGPTPHYKFDGRVVDVPFKGGTLDFDGTFEADGLSEQILETAHAEGRLRARSIGVAAEAEFRTATACFAMQGSAGGLQWKLASIEASLGSDTYTGAGSSQPDGKLVLDLTRGGRPVRFTAALVAAP